MKNLMLESECLMWHMNRRGAEAASPAVFPAATSVIFSAGGFRTVLITFSYPLKPLQHRLGAV